MTDITKDVQVYLQENPLVAAIVPSKIGRDDAFVEGWIYDSKLEHRIENTRLAAIVVRYNSGWQQPSADNTVAFPLVTLDIYSDPDRQSDQTPIPNTAKSKAWAIFDVIKPLLHLTKKQAYDGSAGIFFNGTRITSSELLAEPIFLEPEGGNGLLILRASFAISIF